MQDTHYQVNKERFSAAKNIINKIENHIKENQSFKNIVCVVYRDRMWVSTALLFFSIPKDFLVLSFHLLYVPKL